MKTARPSLWALLIATALGAPAVMAQSVPQPGVEDVLAQPQPLSDRDKLAYAQETLHEIARGVDRVQKDADDAKKDRDILKLNCLNEKLSDLKALQQVAETANAQMEAAVQKAQDEDADHEFQRIVIVRKRVADLVAKAGECTGEGLLQSGEGQTRVDVIGSDITDVLDPDDTSDVTDDNVDLPPANEVTASAPQDAGFTSP